MDQKPEGSHSTIGCKFSLSSYLVSHHNKKAGYVLLCVILTFQRWGDHKNPSLAHTDSMSEDEEYTSEGEDSENDVLSDIPGGLSEEVVPKAAPLSSISSDDTSALSSVGGATCSLQKLSFGNDTLLRDPDGKHFLIVNEHNWNL